jgi:hypothetical protein
LRVFANDWTGFAFGIDASIGHVDGVFRTARFANSLSSGTVSNHADTETIRTTCPGITFVVRIVYALLVVWTPKSHDAATESFDTSVVQAHLAIRAFLIEIALMTVAVHCGAACRLFRRLATGTHIFTDFFWADTRNAGVIHAS